MTDPTTFEWWAYIVIPSLVGVATVIVSGVALWVSHRATVLASKVEAQRAAAEGERVRDSARERLQAMAIDDARALHRWAVEDLRSGFNVVRVVGLRDAAPGRTPDEQAAIDARVQLEQSIVPGAADIFALTKFDLRNRDEYLPEPLEYGSDAGKARIKLRDAIRAARDRRMFERIRAWALDPQALELQLELDLQRVEADPENYLKIGPTVD